MANQIAILVGQMKMLHDHFKACRTGFSTCSNLLQYSLLHVLNHVRHTGLITTHVFFVEAFHHAA